MRTLRFIIGFSFFTLLTFGTEPIPPPYSKFTVNGSISRVGRNDLGGVGIILLGQMPKDTVFRILRGRTASENSIAFTDPTGAFTITVSSWDRMDSLKIGAIILDKPTVTSPAFYVDTSMAIQIIEQYKVQSESGCAGCIVDSETKNRIVSYWYQFSNINFTIPF